MRLTPILCAALFAGSCLTSFAAPPKPNSSQLGNFVVVGDSLAAGYQNFSLYTTNNGGQPFGFANVIAQQAGANLNLPTVTYPGIPPALTLSSTGQIVRAAGFGLRVSYAQTQDLSVPGYLVADALGRTVNLQSILQNVAEANPIDVMAATILGVPSTSSIIPCGASNIKWPNITVSSVDCAVQQHPNTILLSLGNNDVLQTLMFGTPPTDPGTFATEYAQVMSKLSATGARILVTNIPDVTSIPFLIPVPAFTETCGIAPANATAADYVVAKIADPNFSGDVCTDYAVLPASAVAGVQQVVAAYNSIIQGLAAQYGATVFDLNGLFAQIKANGYKVGSQTLTAAPMGGIFSLDGMHPTDTGYAIMANSIIAVMNSKWHTNIPPVSLVQVAKNDPLVPAK